MKKTLSLTLTVGLSLPAIADELDPEDVMQAFRAQGENAFSAERISGFDSAFGRTDIDGDGFLTIEEYVGNSTHFAGHPEGARGFMNVSDNDGDGQVSQAEYVRNRIITDEARDIYTQLDPATDWEATSAFQWRMTRDAFVDSDYLPDRELAEQLFDAMNLDGDDWLRLQEFLPVYGPWARAGLSPELLDGIK